MLCKYQLSFALYPEKWYRDTGWAQVGAGELLLFTAGAGELGLCTQLLLCPVKEPGREQHEFGHFTEL